MTIIREQIIWTLIELWSLGLPRESMPYLENVASLMLEIFPQPKCRIIIVIYKTGELRFVLETASLKHYRTLTASLGIHSEHSHHLKRNNNTEIFIYWSIIIFDRCKLIQVISRCILWGSSNGKRLALCSEGHDSIPHKWQSYVNLR